MSGRSEERARRREQAFGALFDAHWGRVRHHIEGSVEDDAQVGEIVSEVFLEAWTRSDPARPKDLIWLLRTADRTLRARPTAPATRGSAVDAVHRSMTGDTEAHESPRRAETLAALGTLRRGERRIIMLTYWDGLSVGEIAELLRSPRVRVRRRLDRARVKLRTGLGLEGRGDGDG